MPDWPRIRAPVGKSGALHMLHQPFGADRRVVHIGAAGGEHLAEIVRRDVGRHADGDAAGAVDQQVGEARREDLRLLRC